MPVPTIGAHIECDLVLDPATIRAGADLVGDANPLHHDEAFATRSRYGGLIASGAHTAALLAGLATQGFGAKLSDGPGAVGVEINVRFVAPIRALQPLRLRWQVVGHEPRRSGTLVRLEGGIADADTSAPLLTATMTVLYFSPSPPGRGPG